VTAKVVELVSSVLRREEAAIRPLREGQTDKIREIREIEGL
jgi:hypothetical protein